MKRSWADRGFVPCSRAAELSFPSVITAVLSERAPGAGHAQGVIIMWARNADSARRAVRQHFGGFFSAKAFVVNGLAVIDEIAELIPPGMQTQIRRSTESFEAAPLLLEYAVFSLQHTDEN